MSIKRTVVRMKNPKHPGLGIKVDCLEPFGLSITEGANILGVSRSALSALVNERADLSMNMAIRVAKAFVGHPKGGCAYSINMIYQKWKNGPKRSR